MKCEDLRETMKFKCLVCNKLFKHKSWMEKHYLVHSKEKNITCSFCTKRFKQKGKITRIFNFPQLKNNFISADLKKHIGKYHQDMKQTVPKESNKVPEVRLSDEMMERFVAERVCAIRVPVITSVGTVKSIQGYPNQ